MTMFTIAGKPVTKDEFARAAQVCLGASLDDSIVHTVYRIFDVDGKGCSHGCVERVLLWGYCGCSVIACLLECEINNYM